MSSPSDTPLRVYIAGPMTGHPDLNLPAHRAETVRVAALGHEAVSPAAIIDQSLAKPDCLRAAIGLLLSCDAIQLMPGWERSEGVRLELAVAKAVGLTAWYPPDRDGSEGGEHDGLRDQMARSIRDAVRLRYGPGSREILERGGEVCLNGGEADTAADAALAVVQPLLDVKDAEIERLRELLKVEAAVRSATSNQRRGRR